MDQRSEEIHVLHVDDEPDFASVATEWLRREDDRFVTETATRASEGLDWLEHNTVDCVVSDYDMPEMDGIEFLEAVREAYPDLPFILFTGKGSEEIASEAISTGVTDYLQKGHGTSQYAVLANRIVNAVERRRSQAALEASQERLSLFFEQSPLGVIEWDEAFTVVRMNEAAEEILGYGEAELRGESWERIVPEPDRGDVDEVVSELLTDRGGYHSINENVRGDGERITCEWHNRVVTDEDGSVVAIFSQFQEITERRRRKAELTRTNTVLRTVLEQLPMGVLVEDASRNILAVNQQLCDMLDAPVEADDLRGRDCGKAAAELAHRFADPDGFVSSIEAKIERRERVDDEVIEVADGRTLYRDYVPYELPDGQANLWIYREDDGQ